MFLAMRLLGYLTPRRLWHFVVLGGAIGLLLPVIGVAQHHALLRMGVLVPAFYWHFTVAPLLGAVAGLLAGRAVRDRSQRAADRQREARQVLTVFDGTGVGVYRSTWDGRLVHANQGMADLFGFDSPQEMRGLATTGFYADGSGRADLLRRLEADGSVYEVPLRLVRRNGEPFWGHLTAHVQHDHILGILTEGPPPASRDVVVCSSCDRARGSDGSWWKLSRVLVTDPARVPGGQLRFSHGLCPDCGAALYGELWEPS